MMNVLMISLGDSILSYSGGEAYARHQAYAKALGSIDMIVFSPLKHKFTNRHDEYLSIYPTRSLHMLTFVYDALKIARHIVQHKKIDVITTQDPFGTALIGYFLKKKYGIPLHIQNHSSFLKNSLWIQEKPLLFTLFHWILHWVLPKADRLRVVNKMEKQKYCDILKILPEKIDVAPVPLHVDFWKKTPSLNELQCFQNEYTMDVNKPTLSWVGRVADVKNLDYLFGVIAHIETTTPVNFLLACEKEPYHAYFKMLEKKYHVQPIYLGFLEHTKLRTMYYVTDVYVHTSNYEGFGRVIADAQACGVPVVTRNTDGAHDIIENENSGLIIYGDEKMFAESVLKLVHDKQKMDEMCSYAKEMMYKFDYEKMFDATIDSIRKTCRV
ncbi:MAG: hypothetical protein KU29_01675 [Sulfurovum sp. FS06-10]|nr:MAG: hypothetical protein KU29_01675 [Sulfurovum sp. FS06-10]